MSLRGNPYDNAKMESRMKTLKAEGVYSLEFEIVEDVAERPPAFTDNAKRLHSSLGHLSPEQYEKHHTRLPFKISPDRVRHEGPIHFVDACGRR